MNPHTIKRLFPNASPSVLAANAGDYGEPHDNQANPAGIPDTKLPQQPPALEGAGEGEAPGTGCAHVCFTLFRVKLLDVDAKVASTKDLLDGLATAGLIRGDREGEISLEVRQEKVRTYKDEKTEITITYP